MEKDLTETISLFHEACKFFYVDEKEGSEGFGEIL
jgi:hypothetical protein